MNKPENTALAEHFDRLLDLYLERKASDEQKAELRELAEQFGDRFQAKFDSVINAELAGEEMSEQSRQEILTNILSRQPAREAKSRTLAWKWAAAAAILVATASIVWMGLREKPADKIEIVQIPVDQEQKYYSGRQFVKLSDGSTVLMSENAKLRVSENFNKNVREVELEGKAYFDIAHNADKEFRIITGEVITTVLGTAFSIDAKVNKETLSIGEVEVTVTRGKVRVGDKDKVYSLLTRDQQIKIDVESKHFVASAINAEKVTEWKKEFLVFDNVTMDVAATIIYDKYNVKINYNNEAVRNCTGINADFISGETLEQVLEVISTLVHVNYKMLPDGNVLFEGEGCPAVP